jgi:hypothetical protein
MMAMFSRVLRRRPSRMTEVANIKRQLITPKNRRAAAAIRAVAYDTYSTRMHPAYLHAACNTFTKGFSYTQDGRLVAFCTWKEQDFITFHTPSYTRAELYMFLVCSVNGEKDILDMILYDVEQYCIQKGINVMGLEPDNDTIREYYLSKGFIDGQHFIPTRMCRPVITAIQYCKPRPILNTESTVPQ